MDHPRQGAVAQSGTGETAAIDIISTIAIDAAIVNIDSTANAAAANADTAAVNADTAAVNALHLQATSAPDIIDAAAVNGTASKAIPDTSLIAGSRAIAEGGTTIAATTAITSTSGTQSLQEEVGRSGCTCSCLVCRSVPP